MIKGAGSLLDDIINDHNRKIADLLTRVSLLESERGLKGSVEVEPEMPKPLAATCGGVKVGPGEGRLMSWQEWIESPDGLQAPEWIEPRKQGKRKPDKNKRKGRMTPVTSRKDEIIQWRNSGHKIREIVCMLMDRHGIDTNIQAVSANLKNWGLGAYGKDGFLAKAREARARDELIRG
jgi:hypothetical protein